MKSLEKSRKCFSLRNTHRTQCTKAPNASGAMLVSDQRVKSAPDALHRTQEIYCVRIRCLLGSVR